MAEPLRFDPDRFRSAAAHYLSGRPAYAPSVIRCVAERCGLGAAHRVLDLGCGPGQLAIGFAFFAGTVVAMDPEPEMLRRARERAAGLVPNVSFLQGSSYDLGAAPGRFRLAVMGRSFHWMDREATLRRLDAMIEPGGAVALFAASHPDIPQNRWARDYRATLRRYETDDGARSTIRSPDWVRHEGVLLDSAFSRIKTVSAIERREVTVESLVARALSMSTTSPQRLGGRMDAMLNELRALLDPIAENGMLAEFIETHAIVARRSGE